MAVLCMCCFGCCNAVVMLLHSEMLYDNTSSNSCVTCEVAPW